MAIPVCSLCCFNFNLPMTNSLQCPLTCPHSIQEIELRKTGLQHYVEHSTALECTQIPLLKRVAQYHADFQSDELYSTRGTWFQSTCTEARAGLCSRAPLSQPSNPTATPPHIINPATNNLAFEPGASQNISIINQSISYRRPLWILRKVLVSSGGGMRLSALLPHDPHLTHATSEGEGAHVCKLPCPMCLRY